MRVYNQEALEVAHYFSATACNVMQLWSNRSINTSWIQQNFPMCLSCNLFIGWPTSHPIKWAPKGWYEGHGRRNLGAACRQRVSTDAVRVCCADAESVSNILNGTLLIFHCLPSHDKRTLTKDDESECLPKNAPWIDRSRPFTHTSRLHRPFKLVYVGSGIVVYTI